MFSTAIAAFGSCAITVAAMAALRRVAYVVDLLDRPGGHKTHREPVPVVGGLSMLLGIVFGLAVHSGTLGGLQPYVVSAVMLVVVGLIDDRFTLMPGIRLVAQFAAVVPMVFGAGVRLSSFGDLLGTGPLDVTGFELLSTAIVAIAAINAFNMVDGLDGLAGGLALTALVLLAASSGPPLGGAAWALLAVVAGALAGFLAFNLPVRWCRPVRSFMGDAGSMLIGFSLAWLMIGASQGRAPAHAPVTMVWLVFIPATDLVSAVLRRLLRGQSPLAADMGHLHHMLLRAGLGDGATLTVLLIAAVSGGVVGLELERHGAPEWLSFLLLLAGGAGVVSACRLASRNRGLAPARPDAARIPIDEHPGRDRD